MSPQTDYTITATSTAGSTTATIAITVNAILPSALVYDTNSATYTVGTAIADNTALISNGGAAVAYSISPALPVGLNLNVTTGVISGTPAVANPQTDYTVTATNTAGSTTATITIAINAISPSALTYNTAAATYAVGTAIANNTPTVSSGGADVTYSISAALPAGLSLNATTGVISGTPAVANPQTDYIITATNTAGSTTATITITVNAISPSALTYDTTTASYTVGTAITDNTPTINSGGSDVSYSISPTLPAGLNLNTTTGVIYGTPSVASPSTDYTLTATNTTGSTTTTITIVVNAISPSALTYDTATATYTVGTAIADNTALISNGGAAVAYSIGPALPVGLNLNVTTGVISGTPAVANPQTDYTVTATNTAGSTTATITITVNAISPSALTYNTATATYSVGTAIANNTPSVSSGGVDVSYSISAALPAGLSLNATTGVISGTPAVANPQTDYIITATNTAGSTTATITITVNAISPSALTYDTTTASYTVGTAITDNTPTINSGGSDVSYSISPTLPAGLNLNTTTGVIYGTPSVASPSTDYTLTATNTTGSTTTTITIVVNAISPSALTYDTATATYTVGTAIADNTALISNGGAAVAYSIGPALPVGLNLNVTTGVISGTPAVANPQTDYTVTATNTAGSTTAIITITVNATSPSALTYTTATATYTVGTAIADNTPTVSSGGAAVSYSVNPTLPAGLSLDATTGVVSGTPSVASPQTDYTIAATNSVGSTTTTIVITVASACTQPTDPSNGTYAECDQTAPLGTCTLTCSTGYTKSGDAVCMAGSWTTPTCAPNTAAFIEIVSGNSQQAVVMTTYAQRLTVRLTDVGGNPVADSPAIFEAPWSGASSFLSAVFVLTDVNGEASIQATANEVAGDFAVSARIDWPSPSVQFLLSNTPDVAAALRIRSDVAITISFDDEATARPPVSLTVEAIDRFGNPVPDTNVFWAVPSQGASAILGVSMTVTDADGLSSITATPNPDGGTGTYLISAAIPSGQQVDFASTNVDSRDSGEEGGNGIREITVISGSNQQTEVNTAFDNPLRVRVALDDRPIQHANVTFQVASGEGANTAAAVLSSYSVMTDSAGEAVVTAVANLKAGDYDIEATVAAGARPARFEMAN